MKLMILPTLLICLSMGLAFGQEAPVNLQACGTGEIISQSSDASKTDLEFTSNESIAKCFNNLNNQMNEAGWERIKSDNNIYRSDFYRITYSQNGQKAILLLRQSGSSYRVILDF